MDPRAVEASVVVVALVLLLLQQTTKGRTTSDERKRATSLTIKPCRAEVTSMGRSESASLEVIIHGIREPYHLESGMILDIATGMIVFSEFIFVGILPVQVSHDGYSTAFVSAAEYSLAHD